MFWTIVGAILFIWIIFKIIERVYRKLHDPIGRARRIANGHLRKLQDEEAKKA